MKTKSGLDALIKLVAQGKQAELLKRGQDPKVAGALEQYLTGKISSPERISVVRERLPIRPITEIPQQYTDQQIIDALMANKRPKAFAPIEPGAIVGNRLDIPAYTQHGVYVDTSHAGGKGSPLSYTRTGHLKDVSFESDPDFFARVGLGTKEQGLTPLGAEMGAGKGPSAVIKGTQQATSEEEIRRAMSEIMNDPNWAQVGMNPYRHSQFYDKSDMMPVWSAEEKLQVGPLVMVPRRGLEKTDWDDPRLKMRKFEGKKYAEGGEVEEMAGGGQTAKMLQQLYRGFAGAPDKERIFASPQRRVAEYYADKRAAQTGQRPGLEAVLVDPFAGRRYGHALPIDQLNREYVTTQARELSPLDVVSSQIIERKEGGKTPAWQRKEGKNPEGGLNAKGRASYKAETGGTLKRPQPEGGPRKKSFCARMTGMKKKLTSAKTANDPNSRINKSLRAWNC